MTLDRWLDGVSLALLLIVACASLFVILDLICTVIAYFRRQRPATAEPLGPFPCTRDLTITLRNAEGLGRYYYLRRLGVRCADYMDPDEREAWYSRHRQKLAEARRLHGPTTTAAPSIPDFLLLKTRREAS